MYQNKTHLIIGTRSLLGEGYDNVKINTLINLSSATSFVSVNQIRGRALRKDPDNPYKVTHFWEIISITPDLETGFYDFKRAVKKHKNFLSLKNNGILTKGISHLNIDGNIEHLEFINKNSLNLINKRGDTYVAWKIGEPYKDIF